jgi:hypothetical protein
LSSSPQHAALRAATTIRDAVTKALQIATVEFNRGVRIVDDIGLVTQAPRIAATDFADGLI